MKKPLLFITIADNNNMKYAKILETTFRKFHKDIPFHIVTGEELDIYMKDDINFFYRATPILGEKYLQDYELVVKMDSDSLVLGDLSYIWKTTDYDIGTVLNWNRFDPQFYGTVSGWGIDPLEYMNCGLVAMRSPQFVHHWKAICFSPQFYKLQYREQDLLNILVYYGNYNIRCFDHGDGPGKMTAWWGLIAKGELGRSFVKDEKIYILKGLGDTPFPPVDIQLKVVHMGGGKDGKKDNWATFFPEDVMKRVNEIIL